jgi:uncharacterized protein
MAMPNLSLTWRFARTCLTVTVMAAAIILAAAAVLVSVASPAAAQERADTVAVRARPQIPVPPLPYSEAEVSVVNPADGVGLAGTLTIPRGPGPFPGVVLVSGSGTQDRNYGHYPWNHPTFLVLADQLTRNGIAVLRLDDRGIGGSGGVRNASNAEILGDVLASLEVLRATPGIDTTRVGLIGHSWGSKVAAMVAANSADVRFLIALGGVVGMPWGDAMTAQRAAVVAAYGGTEDEIEYTRRYWRRLQDAAMSDPDSASAAARVHEVIYQNYDSMRARYADMPEPPEERLQALLHQQTRVIVNAWYLEQLRIDPADYLPHIRIPVLGLTGSLDTSAPPELLDAMRKAFAAYRHLDVTTEVLPDITHQLQTVSPGGPSAIAEIEETLAPVVVERIVSWLRQLPEGAASLAITGVNVIDVESGSVQRDQTVLIGVDRIIAVAPPGGR